MSRRLRALGLALFGLLVLAAPARAALPPVGHVFVVILENQDFQDSFGATPKSEYLGRELPAQGQLLTQYHGISHQSLGNYIALVSGQGPNPITQSDCQVFQDFFPGTIGADGQASGSGCVYPSTVKTVADQLTAKGLTWGGYMEDMGNTPGEAKTCRHPPIGSRDNTQSARPTDQYAARHNPFVYFHSIIDTADCADNDVPLDDLPAVLRSESVPSYVFITPDLCADGHDATCPDGSPGGFAGIDAFLRKWVPAIVASRAYRDGGMLVVTFDESAHGADACCVQDAPNTPNAGGPTPGRGGGRIGAVVLSPYIQPGSVNETPYNHYSLLHTVENLFGLEPLGLAAKATTFADDVFNGPRCFDHPLPLTERTDLAPGTLIAAIDRAGRRSLRIRMAHSGQLLVRAKLRGKSRRVYRRHASGCATVTVRLPRGTRSALVKASVSGKREQRAFSVRRR
jgi:hypothetical protein